MTATGAAGVVDLVAAATERFRNNDPEAAERLLRDALARDPAREDAATLLARVLQSMGRLGAAARVLFDLGEAHAFEPALSLRCAAGARQCDRHAEAARICSAALARGSTPELLEMAGHVARETGDFEAARSHYLQALEAGIDLDRHHVLGALANTRRYTDPADPDLDRFARFFGDPAHPPRARASAGFALAKAQDDLGHYEAAATALRQANALVHGAQAWDATTWRGFVAARQAGRGIPAAGPPDPGFVPVFVVGVPRSGTTLTASRLAPAIDAYDRGELRALRFIGAQLLTGGHLGSAAAITEAAGVYRMLAVQDDGPTRHYIDQDPLNFRYLDIAAAMFPQVRIIHVRRDPRDTALSLWNQDFAHPDLAFAYDFADMAAFMEGHAALMRHWRKSLPVPIHEIDYEALVADPEGSVRALAEFVGAEAAVPHPPKHATDAPVQSASVWQARQPVYSTSVGRWRRYAPFVPELKGFAAAS